MSKKYLNQNVYDAAIDRLNYIYDNFSAKEIWLSFSGGKDSTVCYHLMKQICLERDIKTFNVLIIDLEGHYQSHINLIEKIINDTEIVVNGYWVCLPFNLSNASSFYQPKWLCWDEDVREGWIRPMPTNRLIVNSGNHPFKGFYRKGMEFEEFITNFPKFLSAELGLEKIAQVIGIRTQESYNRYLKIKVKQNREFFHGKSWALKQKSTGLDSYSIHPIYDWLTGDVWKYLSGKPYAEVYDKMYLAGIPFSEMRICQPYGEEQRDNINLFAKIEPETWAKIEARVSGGNFARIYKGKNVLKGRIKLPDGQTWESWARLILCTMPPYLRAHYVRRINVFLRWWRKEIYDDIPHVYSKELESNESLDADGLYVVSIHDQHPADTKKQAPSWRRITKVLIKGDFLCKALTFSANQKEYEKLEELKSKYGAL